MAAFPTEQACVPSTLIQGHLKIQPTQNGTSPRAWPTISLRIKKSQAQPSEK
jgi:hypothetical protein